MLAKPTEGKRKSDYPPLLPFGWHSPEPEDLCALCVERFPQSATRKRLWEKFAALMGRLQELDIRSELWLDGSFVTEKPDPMDFDYVIHMTCDEYLSLSPAQKLFVQGLQRKDDPDTDSDGHLLVTYPEGHESYMEGQLFWNWYWSNLTMGHCGIFQKGIVKYQLPMVNKWVA